MTVPSIVNVPNGEGKLFGACALHDDPGMALTRGADELLGRIDGGYVRRAQPFHEHARERTGPAADVEHAISGLDAGVVDQLRRQQARIPAHEAVVGIRCDVEAHRQTLELRNG